MKTIDLVKMLIGNLKTKAQKEKLQKKINALYLFNQLTDEEYQEVERLIEEKEVQ